MSFRIIEATARDSIIAPTEIRSFLWNPGSIGTTTVQRLSEHANHVSLYIFHICVDFTRSSMLHGTCTVSCDTEIRFICLVLRTRLTFPLITRLELEACLYALFINFYFRESADFPLCRIAITEYLLNASSPKSSQYIRGGFLVNCRLTASETIESDLQETIIFFFNNACTW